MCDGLFVCLSAGSKRKLPEDGGSGPREEVWSLRDVVFTEQVQSVKVGTVVKVDGCYVAVHFPALEPHQLLGEARLTNCRLLRKDELVVRGEGGGGEVLVRRGIEQNALL